jgi:hypothetical protein
MRQAQNCVLPIKHHENNPGIHGFDPLGRPGIAILNSFSLLHAIALAPAKGSVNASAVRRCCLVFIKLIRGRSF